MLALMLMVCVGVVTGVSTINISNTTWIGDSIVSGNPGYYSPSDDGGPYGNIQSQMEYWFSYYGGGLPYLNAGRSGQTTTQIDTRFHTVAINRSPTAIFAEGGINDIFTGVSESTYLANIGDMANQSKSSGIPFIYIQYYRTHVLILFSIKRLINGTRMLKITS